MSSASGVRNRLLLGLIVAGAAIVRCVGIGFGLPNSGVRPDELTLIAKVLNFFSGDLNPHFFSYPSFQMYLLFLLYNGYFLIGRALGRFHSLAEFLASYARDPSTFFLLSRAVSVVSGTLCVPVLYRATGTLLGKREAILAAFFLAFAFLHVRDSHFGTTDVLVTLLVMTSVLLLLSAWTSPTYRTLAVAGAFSGLAAATKYMGVLLGVPAYLVLALGPAAPSGRRRWLPGRKLATYFLAFIAAFLAGSPFAALEPMRIRSDFTREVRAVWTLGYPLPSGWIYHLRVSLLYGLGLPLLLASLAGCVLLLRRDWRKGWVFLSFPALYYLLMGKGNRDFVRYAIPLVPFLCSTAAAVIADLGVRLEARLSRRGAILAMALLAILISIPSLSAIHRFDTLLARSDTRVQARRFVEESIPRGSTISEFSSDFGTLELSPTLSVLEKELAEAGSGTTVEGILARARIEAVREGGRPGYRLWKYDASSRKYLEDGKEVPGSPDYLILEDSPLRFYQAAVPAEVREAADHGYVLERSFFAYPPNSRGFVFNELDILYVPFARFGDYRFPGPNIFLYRKTAQEGSPAPQGTHP
jgi:4-amino-4-deoxy-L-arabinose transferase-like glycosyltransferase